ncbi:hypothetical protein Leryth_011468 [Lithospermum erythrorhizon]|nr:hypothetical protein Leryth_011468 [Lithospermum erythrorhizon]
MNKKQINALAKWFNAQPSNVKAIIGIVTAISAIVFLRFVVEDHDNLFVVAEAVHALGLSVLVYKLTKEKTCTVVMEYDIHTLLDLATVATTIWVIYMMRLQLTSTYMEDKDTLPHYYVLLDTRGRLLTALGYGLWPLLVLLSEIVQTFILADYCFYYVKSLLDGQSVLRLPSGVV